MTISIPASRPYQADPVIASYFLEKLLQGQVNTKAFDWLMMQRQKINKEHTSSLFLAFGMASRFFEPLLLQLKPSQLTEAEQIRIGFMPQYWNQLQTARTLLLLELALQQEETYVNSLDRLAETADAAELTALYAALPLLPQPVALRKRAAEGLRTNMTVVFDAIALHNPYPSDYLEEGAWNQMVLKAVFMGRPLYKIYRADTRSNLSLAIMLLDFAHERWSAKRNVTPELWRFIGPYLQPGSLKDMERVSKEGTLIEQEAVVLACAGSALPEARQLLDKHPQIVQQIKMGTITWSSLGQHFNHP